MDTETTLKHILQGTPVMDLVYYETVGSTNTAALETLRNPARIQDWTLFYADEQTAGRGRFDRKWSMQPGASLTFSLAFLPHEAEKSMLPLFSPLAALAVCGAVQKITGLNPQIKWPNDVLLNRRKMSGILSEASWQGCTLDGIVLGIGINVMRGSVPPESSSLFPPTSIETELGRSVDRFSVLHETLLELGAWRTLLGTPAFMDAWKARLAFLGEAVRLEHPDGSSFSGKLSGLTPEGDLLLAQEDGEMVGCSVGDLRLRPVSNE